MTSLVWERVRGEISLGHKKLMMSLGVQEEDVTLYVMKRLYYNQQLQCGVIEVGNPEAAEAFRRDIFVKLHLSVRIRAILSSDRRLPLVTTYLEDESYAEYLPNEVVEVGGSPVIDVVIYSFVVCLT
jgi:hypothetical protein